MGEHFEDDGKAAEKAAARTYQQELRSTISASRTRIARVLVGELVLVLTYVLLPLDGNDWVFAVVIGLIALLIGVLFIARRGLGLSESDTPMLDAVLAASWMLTLLVVGFAAIYFTMAKHGGQVSGLHTKIDGIYFTVTTLSTVGFGDIVATSQAARAVVALQIVFNLTFVAVGFRLLMGAGRRGVVARGGL
jgi:Ion channel